MKFDKTSLTEMRRLAGLEPTGISLAEATGQAGGAEVADPVHPDSPEDEQPLLATPPADDRGVDATGAGPSQHWDLYRELEEQAMQLAKANMEMANKMKSVTEGELTREQRKYLKTASVAVQNAVAAQKEAYRRISEFGSTMLG